MVVRFFLILLLTSCTSATSSQLTNKPLNNNNGPGPRIQFTTKIAQVFFWLEIAKTPSQLERGLMGRTFLSSDAGMLFMFPGEQTCNFWMKDTPLSLDMIFMDKNWKVIDLAENMTPMSETHYVSEVPCQYVLEVNAGMAKKWGIEKGSSAIFIDGQST